MTVRELINKLEDFEDDVEVHFTYNYGDYWHTTVAPPVREVDFGEVRHSEYHRMDREVTSDEESGRHECREAVLLR